MAEKNKNNNSLVFADNGYLSYIDFNKLSFADKLRRRLNIAKAQFDNGSLTKAGYALVGGYDPENPRLSTGDVPNPGMRNPKQIAQTVQKAKSIALRASKISDKIFDRQYLKAIKSKDSKRILAVRDLHFKGKSEVEDNRTFVHSTKAKFNSFDKSHFGETDDGFNGKGFYFASTRIPEDPSIYKRTMIGPHGEIPTMNYGPNKIYSYLKGKREFDVGDPKRNFFEEPNIVGILSKYFYDKNGPTEIIIGNPNNIKSAEAITYDDFGNIIPISQRDNFLINDIRYKQGGQIRKMLTASGGPIYSTIEKSDNTRVSYNPIIEMSKRKGLIGTLAGILLLTEHDEAQEKRKLEEANQKRLKRRKELEDKVNAQKKHSLSSSSLINAANDLQYMDTPEGQELAKMNREDEANESAYIASLPWWKKGMFYANKLVNAGFIPVGGGTTGMAAAKTPQQTLSGFISKFGEPGNLERTVNNIILENEHWLPKETGMFAQKHSSIGSSYRKTFEELWGKENTDRLTDDLLGKLILIRNHLIDTNIPLKGDFVYVVDGQAKAYRNGLEIGYLNNSYIDNGRALHPEMVKKQGTNNAGVSELLYNGTILAENRPIISGSRLLMPEVTTHIWTKYPTRKLISTEGVHAWPLRTAQERGIKLNYEKNWHTLPEFSKLHQLALDENIRTNLIGLPIYELSEPSYLPMVKNARVFDISLLRDGYINLDFTPGFAYKQGGKMNILKLFKSGGQVRKMLTAAGGPIYWLRKRLYNNIEPFGYNNVGSRLINAIVLNKNEHNNFKGDYSDIERAPALYLTIDNIWGEYLHIPEKERRYSNGKYKIKNNGNGTFSLPFESMEDIMQTVNSNNPLLWGLRGKLGNSVVGEYDVHRGYDKNGDYLKYIDHWRINPYDVKEDKEYGQDDNSLLRWYFKGKDDASFGLGTPVEIQGKYYLDDIYNVKGKDRGGHYLPEIIVTGKKKQGGKMNILEFLKNGSGIHIKKKNRGKFTSYCGGKVTDECIRKAKSSGNPTLVKRATFALNARRWKHKEGGIIKAGDGLSTSLFGLLPGVGTYLDYKEFEKNPNWKTGLSLGVSALGDAAMLTGAGALIKGISAANKARKVLGTAGKAANVARLKVWNLASKLKRESDAVNSLTLMGAPTSKILERLTSKNLAKKSYEKALKNDEAALKVYLTAANNPAFNFNSSQFAPLIYTNPGFHTVSLAIKHKKGGIIKASNGSNIFGKVGNFFKNNELGLSILSTGINLGLNSLINSANKNVISNEAEISKANIEKNAADEKLNNSARAEEMARNTLALLYDKDNSNAFEGDIVKGQLKLKFLNLLNAPIDQKLATLKALIDFLASQLKNLYNIGSLGGLSTDILNAFNKKSSSNNPPSDSYFGNYVKTLFKNPGTFNSDGSMNLGGELGTYSYNNGYTTTPYLSTMFDLNKFLLNWNFK